MPTVPQAHREVSPNVARNTYINANMNRDVFGENVSAAYNNLGKSMSELGDAAVELKNRIDSTRMVEINNKHNEWMQQNFYDKDTGYQYVLGKDAYGKSEEYIKNYDKYMSDLVKEAKLSPFNQQRLRESMVRWKGQVNELFSGHDFKQGVVWSKQEAAVGLENQKNNAINMRNIEGGYEKAIETGNQLIEWQGEIQHLDKSTIDAQKKQFKMSVNEGVLSSYLGEGSLKAKEFFEKHKEELPSDKLDNYIRSVNENELTYTSRQTALGLIGLGTAEAYNKINAIENPQERYAVLREYNLLTSQNEAIQKEKNDKFMSDMMNQVSDVIANGGDPNYIKRQIMQSDLPYEVKKKQIDYINDCLELGQEVNLWNHVEYLNNLKCTDFETFQKLDLNQFHLTKSEREEFLEAQRKIPNYSTQKQLREMVKKFDTFFAAGKNSLDENVYKDELIGMLARIERMQGKAFDIKNIDEGQLAALRAGFDYEDSTVKNKNINETKELYMRAKAVAEVQDRVAKSYVMFRAQNKREPEPQEMFNMVQKIYNDVGREVKERKQNAVNIQTNMQKNINSAVIKKVGYTKVLTNFEERTIPDIERKTGVKMKITSTYRSTGKYGHEKGLKADVFPANPTDDNILKSAEALIASPDVEIIFTSNPKVLARFGTNRKVKNASEYDKSAEAKKSGINHVTHFDITLTKRFGGTEQIAPAVLTSKSKSKTHISKG